MKDTENVVVEFSTIRELCKAYVSLWSKDVVLNDSEFDIYVQLVERIGELRDLGLVYPFNGVEFLTPEVRKRHREELGISQNHYNNGLWKLKLKGVFDGKILVEKFIPLRKVVFSFVYKELGKYEPSKQERSVYPS